MNPATENRLHRACSAAATTPVQASVVLVVEDDATVRQFLVRTLARAGWSTLEADHGRAALTLLAAHPVDLLLTDLVMPEAEGIELIIKVRRTRPRLPILAISGEGPEGPDHFLTTARLIGANRTLAKPIHPDELRQTVHELLESASRS